MTQREKKKNNNTQTRIMAFHNGIPSHDTPGTKYNYSGPLNCIPYVLSISVIFKFVGDFPFLDLQFLSEYL